MPEGYYGTLVSGLPNLFTVLGPNTGTGHMSVIHFMESQMNLIEGIIKGVKKTGADSFNVRPEAQHSFNERVQALFANTVWASGNCRSWYQGKDGRILALWPG